MLECRVLPPQGRNHDTLWDIAGRHLGEGIRWREIYALNEGRLMPDGRRLTRASLIHPGWILRLPADALILDIDRVTTPTAPAAAAAPTGGGAQPPTEPAPPRPQPEPDRDQATPAASHPQPASALPDPASAHRATDAPVRPEPTPTGDQSDPSPTAEIAPVALTGLLSLAALGLLAALTRRRKVAARRRPPGARAATPPPTLRATEARLRRDARAATEIAATVRLAMLLAAQRAPDSSITAVWHHPDDSLELVLTQPPTHTTAPHPQLPHDGLPDGSGTADTAGVAAAAGQVPFPFEPTRRGWLLPPDNRTYLFATSRGSTTDDQLHTQLQTAVDPFPLLLPAGQRDGSSCLVNLETFGLIGVLPAAVANPDSTATTTDSHDSNGSAGATDSAGATESAAAGSTSAQRAASTELENLLAAFAQALAGAPWAELMQIAVTADLAPACAGLDRVDLLSPELLASIERTVASDEPLTAEHPSLDAARRADPDGAGILGTVAVLGASPEQLPARLLLAATRPSEPLVAVLRGSHPDAHLWQLHPDGTLTIPGIAEHLHPLRLDDAHQQQLLRLLEHAQDPPLATADDSGRLERNADSPPTSPSAHPPTDATDPPYVTGADTSPGKVNEPDGDPAARTADGDGAMPADAGLPDLEDDRSIQITDLRAADLASPADPPVEPDTVTPPAAPAGPDPHGPVHIGVLGPLQVTGTVRPPRNHLRQLLVYLAVHRRPVQPEQLWESVWPDKDFDGHILRSRMSDVKKYLNNHVARHGRAWLLQPDVSCDWQQFKALAASDPDRQLAALALVRGRPFEDVDADWMHMEGQHAEIEAAIVDLALLVAQRSLDAGDHETASTAAAAGLRASPYEERLYQLAMRAAADRGAHSEIRALARRLEHVLDEELHPDDSLQPGTSELYRTLLDTERHPHR